MVWHSVGEDHFREMEFLFREISGKECHRWVRLCPDSRAAILAHLFSGCDAEDLGEIIVRAQRYRANIYAVAGFFGWVPLATDFHKFAQPLLSKTARRECSMRGHGYDAVAAYELHERLFQVVKR